MKRNGLLPVILLVTALPSLLVVGRAEQAAPTALEILQKVDRNMVFKTARSEIEMRITIGSRVNTKRLSSISEGNERSFIEFRDPPRDKGTRILRMDDIVKVYYPSAERIMRLSGHMMRRSMMGSDFSYEDMTQRATKLREEYDGKVVAEEHVMDRPCYLLELTAKEKKRTYYVRKIWVDRERFVGLKEELYARSGKLLKVLTVEDLRTMKARYYPTRITMEDRLRRNSKTEMIIKEIEFDIDIPPETFSERRLQKK